jgi:hypothetical protein
MASVPFESLQGQPQRIFPVHDLGNGISYDQALRVTNAMQDQLHILERTSGNFPFPDKVPKYIAEKVARYSAEFQEDNAANAELEARLHASLHNEVEEEQRRAEAMSKAQDKVQMFQSISDMGLDSMSDELNEVNPFSPEGMAHLDWKSRQMHGAPFENMRAMLQKGQIKSQFKADKLMEQVEGEAARAAKKRVEESDPLRSLLPSNLQFSQPRTPISVASSPGSVTSSPASSPQSPGTFAASPNMSTGTTTARMRQALAESKRIQIHEQTQQQAKAKQTKAKAKTAKVKTESVSGAGAATTEFTRATRGKRQSQLFDDEF